jgi:hypothetical protein
MTAGESDRRNSLARGRGFRNRAEERKYRRSIRNRSDLDELPKPAREQRRRALAAVSLMREDPSLSLSQAASAEGTTPDAVRWYTREALDNRGGQWRATGSDRLYRPMFVYSGGAIV